MLSTKINRGILSRADKRLLPIIKNNRTASYFTITISLLSLSFFGLFAIRPTIITAVSLIKSVSDLRKLNQNYENKISNIIQAQAEYEKIRQDIEKIETALPSNANFQQIARALENFAVRSNININQLQIDQAPISPLGKTQKMENTNFVLIATGNYPSVYSYISHLLNWKRIITIKSMEISQEASTASGNLHLTLKGSGFYEP